MIYQCDFYTSSRPELNLHRLGANRTKPLSYGTNKDVYCEVLRKTADFAAACSQGLVASVWWCNAVTVLLQSSRKASATAFRTTPASNKDTYTALQQCGHCCLSGLTERRRAEAKGGERKCHVLVMKYKASSGFSPKPIWLHVSRG